MSGATEESNEKHLQPWSEACHRDGISNTPLSPYMDQELLYNRSVHIIDYALPSSSPPPPPPPSSPPPPLLLLTISIPPSRHLHIDGTKIEATGFKYEVREITVELLREVSCDPIIRPSHTEPCQTVLYHIPQFSVDRWLTTLSSVDYSLHL